MELLTTATGNKSAPDPETAGFRGCDSLTLEMDLIRGAGQLELLEKGMTKQAIADQLGIGIASVYRIIKKLNAA